MKRVVIYQSGTGFTAKYAGWIADQLGCECKDRKKTKLSGLSEYDQVIYGGWIMGNHIVGLNKIRKQNPKKLVIFGVGMTPAGEKVKKTIQDQNHISTEPFFYYEGGYRPEKMGFVKGKLMGIIKRSIEKKENKTKEDLHMLETFAGADRTDKNAISGLIQYCNQGK